MRPRTAESGVTLVELLVAVAVLGIISYALTESLMLGLRTSDGTAANISSSIASRTVSSYLSDDVHSSTSVHAGWVDCPSTDPGGVVLALGWTDQGVSERVLYALEPPNGANQSLVRWSCTGTAASGRRVLGQFTRDAGGPPPVSATWDCDDDPSCPGPRFDTVTMRIQSNPQSLTRDPVPPQYDELTVRRRTT